MWFKDEDAGSTTWAADSPDLSTWTSSRPVITGQPHEGPNVFELGGWYWMIVDEWHGQRVYRSGDLDTWERGGLLLDSPGTRGFDQNFGHHADVVVGADPDGADVGWIFYFTHRVQPSSAAGRALEALRAAGAPVTAVDILPDPAIRQELQAISGWPTIPQVFVKGELIGGADITQELGESGELAKILADKLGAGYRDDAVEHVVDVVSGARV